MNRTAEHDEVAIGLIREQLPDIRMIFQLTHLVGGFQIAVGVPSVDDDEVGVVGDFVFIACDAATAVTVVVRSLVMRE